MPLGLPKILVTCFILCKLPFSRPILLETQMSPLISKMLAILGTLFIFTVTATTSKDKKFLTLGASLDTCVTSSKDSFIKPLTKRSAVVTNTFPFSTICREK